MTSQIKQSLPFEYLASGERRVYRAIIRRNVIARIVPRGTAAYTVITINKRSFCVTQYIWWTLFCFLDRAFS